MYKIKTPKKTNKRQHNQIRKRYLEDIDNQKEESMKVIDYLFDIPVPWVAPEEKRSRKRKKKLFRSYGDKLKKKKYNFRGGRQLKKRDVVKWLEPLTGWTSRRTV